jgi:hypothetical protein
VLEALEGDFDVADPRVRSRQEWKDADVWFRSFGPGEGLTEEEVDDAVRQAEAHRDLLGLATAEIRQTLDAEERTRALRLREDEQLLAMLQLELKVYAGLIAAAFFLPPVIMAPFGEFLLLGLIPSIVGMLRMLAASKRVSGRGWLILQDRVDQVTRMIPFAHGIAGSTWLIGALWLFFQLVMRQPS